MSTEILSEEEQPRQLGITRYLGLFLLLVAALLVLPLTEYSHSSAAAPVIPGIAAVPVLALPVSSASIAFVRNDEGGLAKGMKHLYLMTPDGQGQQRILRDLEGWDAAWSPAGDRITFTCPMDGNLEICVMNADGSHLTRLTRNGALDQSPTWSPDGSQIAFASDRGGRSQIYRMTATGLGQIPLTHSEAEEREPAWSPDGKRIAYSSDRVVQDAWLVTRDIWVMSPDGAGQVNLTHNATPCVSESPAWSPDSTRLAFSSDCEELVFQIYAMRADGSEVKRLTTSNGMDRHPAWSPQGTHIVFDSTRDPVDSGMRMFKSSEVHNARVQSQVYIMDADGSAVTRLTSRTFESSSRPAWNWGTNNLVHAE